ncbi:probable Na(+)/H(+) antiporter nhx-9 isoform X2 [Lytechinus variegatus]|uniref:probable Na(+)/H(+) antiporter nhx-9 isoform X2 n=1 Tax=Lytechinus variegatus TaxID=7654 RepID=UPI001BB12281|nr:probable Na(+)/H(+) antiporter nhx-9 isoform X2 [Lytechinus variegatus]
MDRFSLFQRGKVIALLLSIALLPAAWAVGPGGDIIEEGCEEFVAHHSAEYNESNEEPESYEILSVNFLEVVTPLVLSFWILVAAVAKVLFHFSPLPKYVPESCLLIAIGFIIGALFLVNTASPFNPELQAHIFFLYLLPPIMMEAGYFMPQAAFWSNIGSILMFAVIGTLINAFTIGLSLWGISVGGLLHGNTTINFLECMTFSSLISAVDPVAVLAVFEEIHVNQVLHILVFGESLLNDAVTVVLYRVFESFNEIGGEHLMAQDYIFGIISFFVVAFGGILIGVIMGFLTAFITKYTYKVRVIEPIFVFVMAYLSYIIAEMLTLSSILAIVSCSMFMKPYVEQNISAKSHTTIKYFLKMLSSISETIIFIFLGTTSLNKEAHQWDTAFVLFTLLFCSVYRAVGVLIQVTVLNRFRLFKINRRSQFIMMYGGIRGAIAFSLVALLCSKVIGAKPIFFTTTVVIIMFTVFIQGITIKPLVNFLHIQKAEKRKPTMNEEIYERFNSHLMAGVEDIVGHHGHHSLKERWEDVNRKFFEKILVREQKESSNYQILDVYKRLKEKEARELIEENKFHLSPSAAELLPRNQSESSLLTPDVSDPAIGQPKTSLGQENVENEPQEGIPRRRKSSFTNQLDAFKKSAYRPRKAHTVRQSRYFLPDEEEVTDKAHQPLAERSLQILHRHKTKKIRMNKTQKGNGRKRSGSHLRNMFKSRSGNNLDKQSKDSSRKSLTAPPPSIVITPHTPSADSDLGITFSAKLATTPNGKDDVIETGTDAAAAAAEPVEVEVMKPSTSDSDRKSSPEDVQFSVEDEKSKDKETAF